MISGNDPNGVGFGGVQIDTGAHDNLVQGNYVGVNANGSAALGNGYWGVLIRSGAYHNTIGGTTAAARNLISGNGVGGIGIAEAGSINNLVQGNYIGTDVTGNQSVGNTLAGVVISCLRTRLVV